MEQVYLYKKINDKTNVGQVTKSILDDMVSYGVKTQKYDKIESVLLEAEKNIKLYAR